MIKDQFTHWAEELPIQAISPLENYNGILIPWFRKHWLTRSIRKETGDEITAKCLQRELTNEHKKSPDESDQRSIYSVDLWSDSHSGQPVVPEGQQTGHRDQGHFWLCMCCRLIMIWTIEEIANSGQKISGDLWEKPQEGEFREGKGPRAI